MRSRRAIGSGVWIFFGLFGDTHPRFPWFSHFCSRRQGLRHQADAEDVHHQGGCHLVQEPRSRRHSRSGSGCHHRRPARFVGVGVFVFFLLFPFSLSFTTPTPMVSLSLSLFVVSVIALILVTLGSFLCLASAFLFDLGCLVCWLDQEDRSSPPFVTSPPHLFA